MRMCEHCSLVWGWSSNVHWLDDPISVFQLRSDDCLVVHHLLLTSLSCFGAPSEFHLRWGANLLIDHSWFLWSDPQRENVKKVSIGDRIHWSLGSRKVALRKAMVCIGDHAWFDARILDSEKPCWRCFVLSFITSSENSKHLRNKDLPLLNPSSFVGMMNILAFWLLFKVVLLPTSLLFYRLFFMFCFASLRTSLSERCVKETISKIFKLTRHFKTIDFGVGVISFLLHSVALIDGVNEILVIN